ncbi:hypothetical protein V8E36_009401 [Tilletia maclaganii]
MAPVAVHTRTVLFGRPLRGDYLRTLDWAGPPLRRFHGLRIGIESFIMAAAALAITGSCFDKCTVVNSESLGAWPLAPAHSFLLPSDSVERHMAGVESTCKMSFPCTVDNEGRSVARPRNLPELPYTSLACPSTTSSTSPRSSTVSMQLRFLALIVRDLGIPLSTASQRSRRSVIAMHARGQGRDVRYGSGPELLSDRLSIPLPKVVVSIGLAYIYLHHTHNSADQRCQRWTLSDRDRPPRTASGDSGKRAPEAWPAPLFPPTQEPPSKGSSTRTNQTPKPICVLPTS